MTPKEISRIREWCEAQMATVSDPRVLAEIIKLRDALSVVASPATPGETDADIQALAERITGRT
jgi:hypothetical protein